MRPEIAHCEQVETEADTRINGSGLRPSCVARGTQPDRRDSSGAIVNVRASARGVY